MGTGKTVLIGAIIATEFAMATDLEARNPGRVFFRILFAYAVIAAPDMAAVAKFLEAEPRVGSA